MNSDPVYQRLREIAWRRPLTAAEQAEWLAWLAAHPEAQAEAELDVALDATLQHQPTPVVSSNFAARVMQAIESEDAKNHSPARPHQIWWRVFVPRFAVAALIVGVSVIGYRQHQSTRQAELTTAAQQLATARALSNPEIIEDFEVIRELSPSMAVADEGLLALSDELLELNK